MQLIENLKWRYATKQFDPNKSISDEQLEYLKDAVQLSVSSYGLQQYKVLIIENQELRRTLKKASYNQSQITDASKLMVFCYYTSVDNEAVDSFIERTANAQGKTFAELQGYGTHIKEAMAKKTTVQVENWAAKQTYLAVSNLLAACAELRIDACPMEGFDAAEYDRILGLTKQGLSTSVIVPIGYRSTKDENQHFKKVRRPKSELFETV